jgi:hypothetical protein
MYLHSFCMLLILGGIASINHSACLNILDPLTNGYDVTFLESGR